MKRHSTGCIFQKKKNECKNSLAIVNGIIQTKIIDLLTDIAKKISKNNILSILYKINNFILTLLDAIKRQC